jgi:hypothetical protein
VEGLIVKIDFNIQKLIEERIGKLTPTRVIIGLAVFIIAMNILGAVLSAVLGFFNFLLPFAVLAIAGYYGYQFLNSPRGQEMLSKATTRAERSAPVIQGEAVKTTPQTADVKAAARIREATTRLEDEAEALPAEEMAEATAEEVVQRLTVPEKINPDTGLKEPDMERLLEKEQEKIQEAKKTDVDTVKAQLEERKKRLKGGG